MQTSSSVPARFVNCFFDGVFAPQRFAEGLRLLAEMLHAQQVSIKLWDRRGSWACLRKARRTETGWQLITEDLAAPPPEWKRLALILGHGGWERIKPLYDSRIARAPVVDGEFNATTLMCLRLSPVRGAEALLSLRQQPEKQTGHTNHDRLALPADLLQSLRIALELMTQCRQLSQRAAYSAVLLDSLRLPLMMLDHSLRLLAANRHAQALIERVSIGAGKHSISLRGLSSNRFSIAVREACDQTLPALGSVLPLPEAEGHFRQVLVLPIMLRQLVRSERAALILVQGTAGSPASAQTLLQQVYGLTPAEARLAMLILEGLSPVDAAGNLQVGIATVRTQLSSILKKTGARKQAELVRRLSPLLVLDRQQSAH